MLEDVYLTAPDGPMVTDAHLSGRWASAVAVLGAIIVAVGGILLTQDSNDRPLRQPATSVTSSR